MIISFLFLNYIWCFLVRYKFPRVNQFNWLPIILLERDDILRALSFCQNWPARPIGLQRKGKNVKEHLHDNPLHSSGELKNISSSKCVNLKALLS